MNEVARRHTVMEDSPIGSLILVAEGDSITGVYWKGDGDIDEAHGAPTKVDALLAAMQTQLAEYFAGNRHEFDLPLHPVGTDFQQRVWSALLQIPYGDTWSYLQLAQFVGSPRGSRAVGLANGRNPIPVVIPCHRVVGSNGSLTGYGGGMQRKRTLLALEASGSGRALF
ncbi:methylated-DNA--[protein]-cysteine S-methyltransferase [Leekyejoonella antrihumi]|uniref:Methylated-DNA--protein-cysteine methyltransferase n=1 Tax=Leekyejoonella antrihumi TaxID=1660198 RepID=A0A563DYI6_9MICO|nr:methylated-DNA--[protein]-cysteine S-methyltransferase [Leekyejoonella antrihumi]TWP34734.1 methylated-DNA--[protein]-cysteine S-methyltransferase [Leekyejoonella antrihumi]